MLGVYPVASRKNSFKLALWLFGIQVFAYAWKRDRNRSFAKKERDANILLFPEPTLLQIYYI